MWFRLGEPLFIPGLILKEDSEMGNSLGTSPVEDDDTEGLTVDVGPGQHPFGAARLGEEPCTGNSQDSVGVCLQQPESVETLQLPDIASNQPVGRNKKGVRIYLQK